MAQRPSGRLKEDYARTPTPLLLIPMNNRNLISTKCPQYKTLTTLFFTDSKTSKIIHLVINNSADLLINWFRMVSLFTSRHKMLDFNRWRDYRVECRLTSHIERARLRLSKCQSSLSPPRNWISQSNHGPFCAINETRLGFVTWIGVKLHTS